MRRREDLEIAIDGRQAFEVIEPVNSTSLPLSATSTDIREAVRFLKRCPEGITVVQAMDAFRKRVFDQRKLCAYESWGIISREGDRLKLSSLGWEFAHSLAPEAELYRTVLRRTGAYHDALRWIVEESLGLVTHTEVGAFWQDQHAETIKGITDEDLESCAASFFHLCHAGEIGTLIVGRKGQPTRLHIYGDQLSAYLGNDTRADLALAATENGGPAANVSYNEFLQPRRPLSEVHNKVRRVFISHNSRTVLMTRVPEAFELADMESEIVVRNQDERAPVGGRAFQAMKRCSVGIIVLTEADYDRESERGQVIDQSVLLEIGASLIHFDGRVILLLQKGVPPPFAGLTCCEFEEDNSTWDMAVQLLRAVRNFQQGVNF